MPFKALSHRDHDCRLPTWPFWWSTRVRIERIDLLAFGLLLAPLLPRRSRIMAADDSGSSIAHSSGLGVMPSMSSECTPLKHRYDACFNKWFEDYLGLPAPSSSSSSTEEDRRDSGVSGFFSKSKTSNNSSTDAQGRKKLRERLDGDCGPFWKEYQGCVLVSLSLL
jgi:hypothetical protein